MGGIENDTIESQKPVPLKPSTWPLLQPFSKFLNDITKQDVKTQLFGASFGHPTNSETKSVLRVLLEFMTAHDFCKLLRLST